MLYLPDAHKKKRYKSSMDSNSRANLSKLRFYGVVIASNIFPEGSLSSKTRMPAIHNHQEK